MSNRPEPKFKVGQVVIVVYSVNWPELAGSEIEIARADLVLYSETMEMGWGYADTKYRTSTYGQSWHEDQLRPLPDGNQPATFDAAIWQPKREGVGA